METKKRFNSRNTLELSKHAGAGRSPRVVGARPSSLPADGPVAAVGQARIGGPRGVGFGHMTGRKP